MKSFLTLFLIFGTLTSINLNFMEPIQAHKNKDKNGQKTARHCDKDWTGLKECGDCHTHKKNGKKKYEKGYDKYGHNKKVHCPEKW
tara:strand:- start:730 stop:987 length:258 start_codon:yes stop_codon:yes gene_type:complete